MQESLRRGGWVWFCGLLPIAGCASTTGVPNGAAGAGAVLVAPSPTTRHHVDISKLASDLRRLPPGERDEQIADWVVAGTLGLEAPDDPEVLAALSQQPIQRDAQLEVLVPFAQGRGRHVLVGQKRVLLFVSARDGQGRATLARLADQARVELGRIPDSFEVFLYRDSASEIEVERWQRLAGADLFSPSFGYVEQTVSAPEDIGRWLSDADDLTWYEERGEGFTIGGRRFSDARTRQIGLEEVAALYQGQLAARPYLETSHRLEQEGRALAEAFNAAIAAFNQEAERANQGQRPACEPFAAALAELRRVGPGLPIDSPPACAGRTVDEVMRADRDLLDRLRPALATALDTLQGKQQAIVREAPQTTRPGPGFSLDPHWEVEGLIRALEQLKRDPKVLVAQARRLAAAKPAKVEAGAPLPARAAASLVELVDGLGGMDVGTPSPSVAGALDAIIAEARQAGGPTVEVLPRFEDLRRQVGDSRASEAIVLQRMLSFIESQHHIQCPRYDGDIVGTGVAMTLYYTDLLGKLWAGLDYQGSAPTRALPGFATMVAARDAQQATGTVTRIWFGLREDRVSRTEDFQVLRFAPVVTRVFSAASQAWNPGQEVVPEDPVRHVLDWWTQHYGQVADLDGQFYLQNQLHKWSVVTAVLAHRGALPGLAKVRVARDQRFDRWLKTTAGVALPAGISLLPARSGDRPNAECMDLLSASTSGEGGFLTGGVTLGNPLEAPVVPRQGGNLLDVLAASGRSGVSTRTGLGEHGDAWLVRSVAPDHLAPNTRQHKTQAASASRAGRRIELAGNFDQGNSGRKLAMEPISDRVVLSLADLDAADRQRLHFAQTEAERMQAADRAAAAAKPAPADGRPAPPK